MFYVMVYARAQRDEAEEGLREGLCGGLCNNVLCDGLCVCVQRDEAEEGRRKLCELARELQRVKGHNLELEAQVQQTEELKTQLADQTASITLLRQACTVSVPPPPAPSLSLIHI